MNNLADTLYIQDNIHDAVVLMEKCVKLRDRLLGSSHPHTINSARSLEYWKQKLGSSTNKRQPPVRAEMISP
jgi:hypothetical protein